MRICLFVGTALPKVGGAEIVVDKLARHWTNAGAEVTVLAPRPSIFAKPDDTQFPYRVLRHPPILSSRYGVEWYGRHLLAAHRSLRFDVVHCHGIFPHGYLAARLKEQLGIPLVFTSHGGDVGPDDRRYAKPRVRDKMLWAMTQLDAMIAIGPFTRRGFGKLCPTSVPIVDIPNGVDFEDFARPANRRPADIPQELASRKYLLFLGRLSRRKGVDLLIEALGKTQLDKPLDVAIAGSGNERPILEQLASFLPQNLKLHFVGNVAGTRKAWLLQNALCTVMPSRGWEAFPLVLLESLAAGTPVIASDAPGLGDLVRVSQGGLTFPMDSASELARTLESCMADEARLSLLGSRGQIFAARHDWSIVAARHLRLFENLCRGRAINCFEAVEAMIAAENSKRAA